MFNLDLWILRRTLCLATVLQCLFVCLFDVCTDKKKKCLCYIGTHLIHVCSLARASISLSHVCMTFGKERKTAAAKLLREKKQTYLGCTTGTGTVYTYLLVQVRTHIFLLRTVVLSPFGLFFLSPIFISYLDIKMINPHPGTDGVSEQCEPP